MAYNTLHQDGKCEMNYGIYIELLHIDNKCK